MIVMVSTASPCRAKAPISIASQIGPSSPDAKVATSRTGVRATGCSVAALAAGAAAGAAGLAGSGEEHASTSVSRVRRPIVADSNRLLPIRAILLGAAVYRLDDLPTYGTSEQQWRIRAPNHTEPRSGCQTCCGAAPGSGTGPRAGLGRG